MRISLLAMATALFIYSAAAARADDLTVDSQFIDTSNQNLSLCVHFSAPLSPNPAIHYGDYVRVDGGADIVTQISGENLCIGGMPYQKQYSVTLNAGLPAKNGDKLAAVTTLNFSPGDRPALVAIGGNGLYLAKRSAGGLAISSVNVKKIELHVLRLNDINAIQDFSLSNNGPLFDTAQQITQGYNLATILTGQAGVVWSGAMAVQTQADADITTLFPIATALGQSNDQMAAKPGVYLVVAEDASAAVPPGFWTGTLSSDAQSNAAEQNFATHWVIVTDLGLTAITGDDGMHVNVRAVATAAPAAGIKLNLISTGGDILATVMSDAGGNAVIPKAELDGHLANAPLAIAAYGPDGDFSYLPLDRAAFDLSDRGVTGRAAPVTNDAFIFADRGIYRPGETVHATVLVRDAAGKAEPDQKISLGLVRPDTVQVATIAATTDDAGGAVVTVPLPANAMHGQWTLQAAIDPTLPPIGSLTVDVENFQPADMRVTASGAPPRAAPGATLNLTANGTYLYGAPASLPVQASITITQDADPIPGVTGYSFGLSDDNPADTKTDIDNDGADTAGNIKLSATLPTPPATTVPLKARVAIAYLEPSGALTSAVQDVKLTTTPTLIGIKPLFQGGAVNSATPAIFDIAAFDPATGKPVAAPALDLRIVRTDTVYDWVGSQGSWTWKSFTVDHPVELGKFSLSGTDPTELSRNLPDGDYTLIISDPQTGAAASTAFSVGWSALSSAAATPDTLDLTADKILIPPGGTSDIQVKGPFAGLADIIIANNRIYSEQQIAIPKDGAKIPITATADWNGGAYVIADLHRGSADAPGHASVRAIGVGWIGLDPGPHTLAIQISAPGQILPRTHQTVTVKVTNAAVGTKIHLVLDVVDEGILGLTKYKTPDPVGWFWGQRALGVEIRDMFGSLLNDQGQPGAIEQGGDEGAGGPRVPLQSTKLFVVASDDLTVGPDGTVQIPLDVPDFEGQARLTAIAWSTSQAGSAMADMLVRDPVVMVPGLPNFLSAGDQMRLPVTLSNLDGPAGAYTLSLKTTGLTASPVPLTINLAKGAAQIVELPLAAASPGIGQLALTIANAAGLTITRPFSIPIRPAHPPAFITLSGKITPGLRLPMPAELLHSGDPTGDATIAVSSFPGLNPGFLMKALAKDTDDNDTVDVASRAFPLLDRANAALFAGGATAAHAAVITAITTVTNRQSMDGDIGDWSFSEGGDGFNDWVSAYAIDFLLTAQAAGYDVPQVVLERSKTWLRAEAAALSQIVSYQGSASGGAAPAPFASFAYTQWLLARTGRPDIGALRIVADGLKQAQSPDGHPLIFWGGGNTPDHLVAAGDLAKLAMALALANDTARATHVLTLAATAATSPGQSEWADSFWWSGNQDAAIVLLAAATIGNQPIFDATAQHIDPTALADNEDDDAIAWLLRAATAGDAYAAKTGKVSIALGANTRQLAIPDTAALDWPDLLTQKSIIFPAGHGYYDFAASYTPTGPTAPYAHGMTLKVVYTTIDGKPVDLSALHQGGDIVVTIAGRVPKGHDNLLQIVSLLPGCFTIEKSMPGPNDIPPFTLISTPENFSSDVDRFVASVRLGQPAWDTDDNSGDNSTPSLPPDEFLVAYIVKVTTQGIFTVPEVTTRDRLHPTITASSGSRTATVMP